MISENGVLQNEKGDSNKPLDSTCKILKLSIQIQESSTKIEGFEGENHRKRRKKKRRKWRRKRNARNWCLPEDWDTNEEDMREL